MKNFCVTSLVTLVISGSITLFAVTSVGAEPQKSPSFDTPKNKQTQTLLDVITSKKEWGDFPWSEPQKSKIIKDNTYQEKIDQDGTPFLSSTRPTSIGSISIDVYTTEKPDRSRKIVVKINPDDATQSTCDAHKSLFIKKFGTPTSTRDTSIPDMMSNISTQWSVKNTIATWTCAGIASKKYSFITFEESATAKPFTPLIPISCRTRIRFHDGETREHQYQFIIDPYSEVVRRADNSILAIASNLLVTDQAITFNMTEKNYSSTVTINRVTGKYEDETYLPTLGTKLISNGFCEKFDPIRKKF